MAKAYMLCAGVSKTDADRHTFSFVQGYLVAGSEDEARGSFMRTVYELKPGFSIEEMLCFELPIDEIVAALATKDTP